MAVSRRSFGVFGLASFRRVALTLLLACSFFGCKESGDQPDSKAHSQELSSVPAFSLTDEDGKPFGSEQLSGKAYLATFMFTRCPSVCPRVTARMKDVDAAVKKAGLALELVSISVDPEYDTPVALRKYAQKHEADVPHWHFLTGDYRDIARTAEQGFKVGIAGKAKEGQPHLGITHGSHLVLVNPSGKIVGYFSSSEAKSVEEIVSALEDLSAQPAGSGI